ncbi:hypothetical protein E2320_003568, partial [Naja naja]
MLWIVLTLWLMVDVKCQMNATPCRRSDPCPILHEWHKPGNLLIGGITAQVIYVLEEHLFGEHPSRKSFMPPLLAFAVKQINSNPKLLSNLAYGSFAPKKHGTKMAASFYHMSPNEILQTLGIIHLLKHFGWTWVGLLILDDDSGDNFIEALDPLLSENKICSAFMERIPKQAFFSMFHGSVVLPRSVCNDPCPAGYQKKKKEGEKFCCYDCDPCSAGKMSNRSGQTDAMSCPRSDPSPILHEWYKPGNLLIGAITAQILAYGSFAPQKHGTKMAASFYRMAPNETLEIAGIIHLLKHFGWTWIGLLILDDDSGDNFLQALDPLLSENGICYAFVERFPKQSFLFMFQVCKFAAETCSKNDPFPVRHEWQQPGDVLLGGMSSQITYIFHPLSFKRHPSEELKNDTP